MKQFNLFPVARGTVAIIHSQYIYIIQIGKGQAHIQKNTYSGQGDVELILNSRQLLNLRIIHSGCKTKLISGCETHNFW